MGGRGAHSSEISPTDAPSSPSILPLFLPSRPDLHCLFVLFPERGSVFKQISALTMMMMICVCVRALTLEWFIRANLQPVTDGKSYNFMRVSQISPPVPQAPPPVYSIF